MCIFSASQCCQGAEILGAKHKKGRKKILSDRKFARLIKKSRRMGKILKLGFSHTQKNN
jgi:hypothetical protein